MTLCFFSFKSQPFLIYDIIRNNLECIINLEYRKTLRPYSWIKATLGKGASAIDINRRQPLAGEKET